MAATPQASRQLSRIESFQYPAGHEGHLQADQQKSLEEFKRLCKEAGYYKPSAGAHLASHDDETLLRFLRARKFKPADALGQFKSTEDWRKQNKIDSVYETIDVKEYDDARRLYPQWTGRRDKRGIPVYVYEVAGLSTKKIADYRGSGAKAASVPGRTPPRLLRLFALYENLTRFVMPLCTGVANRPTPETPVSQSNNIVDISRVGLKQFWDLKSHMQDASTLATAHYPETLDRIFIIGAPSFFPTVWSWIKRWFDPITVSKIFILSKDDVKPTLQKYIDIENIPKKYGGNLEWGWGELPSLETAIQDSLTWHSPEKSASGENRFPAGPIRWEEDDNGSIVAIAVGSESGTQRHTKIASLNTKNADALAGLAPVDFGEPSTTGEHTHPAEGVDYFPPSGNTPPETEDSRAVSEADETQAGPATTAAEPAASEKEAPVFDSAPRSAQPIETSTEPVEGESTYVGQAKAVAGSAAAAVGSVGTSVLAVVGLGSKKPEDEEPKAEPAKPEDPRVDNLKDKDVEEFIRDQQQSQATGKKA